MCQPLRDHRILLVVPPFADLRMPSLGVHLLQSIAKRLGFEVSVHYANLHFAAAIGRRAYEAIAGAPREVMAGPKVFGSLAFDGLPSDQCSLNTNSQRIWWEAFEAHIGVSWDELLIEANKVCQSIGAYVLETQSDVVGCTTTFDQTHAAVAILRAVKQYRETTITVLGGGNCEGVMADALSQLTPFIDFVFSGEAEQSFSDFLRMLQSAALPANKVIRGTPCHDLDDLLCPDYSDYFTQLRELLPEVKTDECWIVYESSRGCWWGQKSHCAFCGLNGNQMAFRKKSAAKVINEIEGLLASWPTRRICMTDNIMPYDYHNSVVPSLADMPGHRTIFYEQRSNLSLRQLRKLKAAGVTLIQIGIESLSTRLLTSLRKGSTAIQNINTLRYARMAGINVIWNHLVGIPGERLEDYQAVLDFIPHLVHLQPPTGLQPISIDRFSPYFDQPEEFGIEGIRPLLGYKEVFPAGAPHADLAYFFEGHYDKLDRKNTLVLQRLENVIAEWRRLWSPENEEGPPRLELTEIRGEYILVDTRSESQPNVSVLSQEQACLAVAGRRTNRSTVEWAIDSQLILSLDNSYVPLVVADEFTAARLINANHA